MRTAMLTFAAAFLLGACSTSSQTTSSISVKPLAFAAEGTVETNFPMSLLMRGSSASPVLGPSASALAGRTLLVRSPADLVFRPKEIVLTFDDGPMPGKTDAILAALRAEKVSATFLMVGQMARAYPQMVRKVAAEGHTIGTHTQNHANLAKLSLSAADTEIEAGRKSVAAALVPTGMRVSSFFRFPYLAETATLHRHLVAEGAIPLGVDIDSKDYFQSTPDQVRARTLAAITARGSGIILFHDIHRRTSAMLPGLLDDLRARGYKVVSLKAADQAGISAISQALTN